MSLEANLRIREFLEQFFWKQQSFNFGQSAEEFLLAALDR